MTKKSDDNSSSNWVKEASEIGTMAWMALSELPDGYSPNEKFLSHEYHKEAEENMFMYYRYFAPRKEQLDGGLNIDQASEKEVHDSIWWQPITEIQIPISNRTVRLNGDGGILNEDISDRQIVSKCQHKLPTRSVVLRLGNLRDVYLSMDTITTTVKGWIDNKGTTKRNVRTAARFPPVVIYDTLFRLDKCLAKAGGVPHFGLEKRPYDDWREEFGESGYTGPDDVDLPHNNVRG